MKFFSVFIIAILFVCQVKASPRGVVLPKVVDNILYINGTIGSHIYDYLSYEYKALQSVEAVSLNSFGGNHVWALAIAEKIKSYGFKTIVERGSVCASACIYLFGVGAERLMHDSVWLGFHAARLSGGHVITFNSVCSKKLFEIKSDQSIDCDLFLQKMYETSLKSTEDGLDMLEDSGVNVSLREAYFLMDDDELWYEHYNVIKKPDWVLWHDEALEHNLATKVYSSQVL